MSIVYICATYDEYDPNTGLFQYKQDCIEWDINILGPPNTVSYLTKQECYNQSICNKAVLSSTTNAIYNWCSINIDSVTLIDKTTDTIIVEIKLPQDYNNTYIEYSLYDIHNNLIQDWTKILSNNTLLSTDTYTIPLISNTTIGSGSSSGGSTGSGYISDVCKIIFRLIRPCGSGSGSMSGSGSGSMSGSGSGSMSGSGSGSGPSGDPPPPPPPPPSPTQTPTPTPTPVPMQSPIGPSSCMGFNRTLVERGSMILAGPYVNGSIDPSDPRYIHRSGDTYPLYVNTFNNNCHYGYVMLSLDSSDPFNQSGFYKLQNNTTLPIFVVDCCSSPTSLNQTYLQAPDNFPPNCDDINIVGGVMQPNSASYFNWPPISQAGCNSYPGNPLHIYWRPAWEYISELPP